MIKREKQEPTFCRHCGGEIHWSSLKQSWFHVHAVTSERTLYRKQCLAETSAEPGE